jgi:hypothetical protein
MNSLISATVAAVALGMYCGATLPQTAGIEKRFSCTDPDTGDDATFAPSYVTEYIGQDSVSRLVSGKIQWSLNSYLSWFKDKRLLGVSPYGMEIETHFYNYDDSTSTGYGPAYMLDWACHATNISPGHVCPAGALPPSLECDLPDCYLDTQLVSSTNSLNEYSQPNLAVGFLKGSDLIVGKMYRYRARGITGRSNKSAVKINLQPTRPIIPGVSAVYNQGACEFSNHATMDVELVPMKINELTGSRIFAPVCLMIDYKDLGISKRYRWCPL